MFGIRKTTSPRKPHLSPLLRNPSKPLLSSVAAAVLLGLVVEPALAAPQGAVVDAGYATFDFDGVTTTIRQTTDRAVIRWQSFDLAATETAEFILPNSSGATLNRIVGGSVTTIYGTITSNGAVYFTNPNGLIFDANSRVTSNGFLATTASYSDSAFMNGTAASSNLGSGSISLNGTITAPKITATAHTVSVDGTLTAAAGTVLVSSTNLTTIGQTAVISANGTASSNGGNVTIWSDGQTDYWGQISAKGGSLAGNGGLVEVSGKVLNYRGRVVTTAAHGKSGRLLLDPLHIEIVAAIPQTPVATTTYITVDSILTALDDNAVTIDATANSNGLATSTGTGDDGTITVLDDLILLGTDEARRNINGNPFSLIGTRITINRPISNSGDMSFQSTATSGDGIVLGSELNSFGEISLTTANSNLKLTADTNLRGFGGNFINLGSGKLDNSPANNLNAFVLDSTDIALEFTASDVTNRNGVLFKLGTDPAAILTLGNSDNFPMGTATLATGGAAVTTYSGGIITNATDEALFKNVNTKYTVYAGTKGSVPGTLYLTVAALSQSDFGYKEQAITAGVSGLSGTTGDIKWLNVVNNRLRTTFVPSKNNEVHFTGLTTLPATLPDWITKASQVIFDGSNSFSTGLTLSITGAISQSAGSSLTVSGGALVLTAGQGIKLDNATNNIISLGAITAGGNIAINAGTTPAAGRNPATQASMTLNGNIIANGSISLTANSLTLGADIAMDGGSENRIYLTLGNSGNLNGGTYSLTATDHEVYWLGGAGITGGMNGVAVKLGSGSFNNVRIISGATSTMGGAGFGNHSKLSDDSLGRITASDKVRFGVIADGNLTISGIAGNTVASGYNYIEAKAINLSGAATFNSSVTLRVTGKTMYLPVSITPTFAGFFINAALTVSGASSDLNIVLEGTGNEVGYGLLILNSVTVGRELTITQYNGAYRSGIKITKNGNITVGKIVAGQNITITQYGGSGEGSGIELSTTDGIVSNYGDVTLVNQGGADTGLYLVNTKVTAKNITLTDSHSATSSTVAARISSTKIIASGNILIQKTVSGNGSRISGDSVIIEPIDNDRGAIPTVLQVGGVSNTITINANGGNLMTKARYSDANSTVYSSFKNGMVKIDLGTGVIDGGGFFDMRGATMVLLNSAAVGHSGTLLLGERQIFKPIYKYQPTYTMTNGSDLPASFTTPTGLKILGTYGMGVAIVNSGEIIFAPTAAVNDSRAYPIALMGSKVTVGSTSHNITLANSLTLVGFSGGDGVSLKGNLQLGADANLFIKTSDQNLSLAAAANISFASGKGSVFIDLGTGSLAAAAFKLTTTDADIFWQSGVAITGTATTALEVKNGVFRGTIISEENHYLEHIWTPNLPDSDSLGRITASGGKESYALITTGSIISGGFSTDTTASKFSYIRANGFSFSGNGSNFAGDINLISTAVFNMGENPTVSIGGTAHKVGFRILTDITAGGNILLQKNGSDAEVGIFVEKASLRAGKDLSLLVNGVSSSANRTTNSVYFLANGQVGVRLSAGGASNWITIKTSSKNLNIVNNLTAATTIPFMTNNGRVKLDLGEGNFTTTTGGGLVATKFLTTHNDLLFRGKLTGNNAIIDVGAGNFYFYTDKSGNGSLSASTLSSEWNSGFTWTGSATAATAGGLTVNHLASSSHDGLAVIYNGDVTVSGLTAVSPLGSKVKFIGGKSITVSGTNLVASDLTLFAMAGDLNLAGSLTLGAGGELGLFANDNSVKLTANTTVTTSSGMGTLSIGLGSGSFAASSFKLTASGFLTQWLGGTAISGSSTTAIDLGTGSFFTNYYGYDLALSDDETKGLQIELRASPTGLSLVNASRTATHLVSSGLVTIEGISNSDLNSIEGRAIRVTGSLSTFNGSLTLLSTGSGVTVGSNTAAIYLEASLSVEGSLTLRQTGAIANASNNFGIFVNGQTLVAGAGGEDNADLSLLQEGSGSGSAVGIRFQYIAATASAVTLQARRIIRLKTNNQKIEVNLGTTSIYNATRILIDVGTSTLNAIVPGNTTAIAASERTLLFRGASSGNSGRIYVGDGSFGLYTEVSGATSLAAGAITGFMAPFNWTSTNGNFVGGGFTILRSATGSHTGVHLLASGAVTMSGVTGASNAGKITSIEAPSFTISGTNVFGGGLSLNNQNGGEVALGGSLTVGAGGFTLTSRGGDLKLTADTSISGGPIVIDLGKEALENDELVYRPGSYNNGTSGSAGYSLTATGLSLTLTASGISNTSATNAIFKLGSGGRLTIGANSGTALKLAVQTGGSTTYGGGYINSESDANKTDYYFTSETLTAEQKTAISSTGLWLDGAALAATRLGTKTVTSSGVTEAGLSALTGDISWLAVSNTTTTSTTDVNFSSGRAIHLYKLSNASMPSTLPSWLTSSSSITIEGGNSFSGSVTLQSAGSISISGTITTVGALSISGTGLTLTSNVTSSGGAVTIDIGSGVYTNGATGFWLDTSNQNLTLKAGSISNTAASSIFKLKSGAGTAGSLTLTGTVGRSAARTDGTRYTDFATSAIETALAAGTITTYSFADSNGSASVTGTGTILNLPTAQLATGLVLGTKATVLVQGVATAGLTVDASGNVTWLGTLNTSYNSATNISLSQNKAMVIAGVTSSAATTVATFAPSTITLSSTNSFTSGLTLAASAGVTIGGTITTGGALSISGTALTLTSHVTTSGGDVAIDIGSGVYSHSSYTIDTTNRDLAFKAGSISNTSANLVLFKLGTHNLTITSGSSVVFATSTTNPANYDGSSYIHNAADEARSKYIFTSEAITDSLKATDSSGLWLDAAALTAANLGSKNASSGTYNSDGIGNNMGDIVWVTRETNITGGNTTLNWKTNATIVFYKLNNPTLPATLPSWMTGSAAIELRDANSFNSGLTLQSAGSINQTEGSSLTVTNGSLTLTAGGDINLYNSGNSFSQLGAITASGQIKLQTSTALSVSGAINSGSSATANRITVKTGGDLTLTADISSQGGDLYLIIGGNYKPSNSATLRKWNLNSRFLSLMVDGNAIGWGGSASDTEAFTNATGFTTNRDPKAPGTFNYDVRSYFTSYSRDSLGFAEAEAELRELDPTAILNPISDMTQSASAGAGFKRDSSSVWWKIPGASTAIELPTLIGFYRVDARRVLFASGAPNFKDQTDLIILGRNYFSHLLDLSTYSKITKIGFGDGASVVGAIKLPTVAMTNGIVVGSDVILPSLSGAGQLKLILADRLIQSAHSGLDFNGGITIDSQTGNSVSLWLTSKDNRISTISGKTHGGSISIVTSSPKLVLTNLNTGGGSVVVVNSLGGLTSTEDVQLGGVGFRVVGAVELQGHFSSASGYGSTVNLTSKSAGLVVGNVNSDSSVTIDGDARATVILAGKVSGSGAIEIKPKVALAGTVELVSNGDLHLPNLDSITETLAANLRVAAGGIVLRGNLGAIYKLGWVEFDSPRLLNPWGNYISYQGGIVSPSPNQHREKWE